MRVHRSSRALPFGCVLATARRKTMLNDQRKNATPVLGLESIGVAAKGAVKKTKIPSPLRTIADGPPAPTARQRDRPAMAEAMPQKPVQRGLAEHPPIGCFSVGSGARAD